MRRIVIGIDDTDNRDSRGTGYLSRRLATGIQKSGLGSVSSISRHQLFVHPNIPYTSKNSSACLSLFSRDMDPLEKFCGSFIRNESAEGACAGMAIAFLENIKEDIVQFGFRSKKEIVSCPEAKSLAGSSGIVLESLTGDGKGMIGALAATGLRRSGNDGRCIWLHGTELRDLFGVYPVREICNLTGIDAVVDLSGGLVSPEESIKVGEWARPVIKDNKILLLAERETKTKDYEWKVARQEYIKSISA